MSKPKLTPWKKGPPPCVGWWNASQSRTNGSRRFWNGYYWSLPVLVGVHSEIDAHRLGSDKGLWHHSEVYWRGLASDPSKGKK